MISVQAVLAVKLVFRVQNLLGESEEGDDAHDDEAECDQLSGLTHLNGGFGGGGNKVTFMFLLR